MALLLGSLRGKFVLMIVLVFAGTAMLTVLSFGWVGSNLARSLGMHFAEKQALHEQARIRAPIQREIALAQKLADSPILQEWAKNEQSPALKQKALAELDSYRHAFQSQSYFFVVSDSLHYYYNDSNNQFRNKELRYRLDPEKRDDSWYFAVSKTSLPYDLNVDVNPTLKITNLWINTLVRDAGGHLLGVAGTGLELSRFIEQFIARGQTGVTNILINAEGAIQAHPERRYIDINSNAKQASERMLIFTLLPDLAEHKTLQAAMHELKNQPETAKTLFLNVEGRQQLVGLAYLPEMQWYNVSIMDPDRIISTRAFLPIIAVLGVALVLSLLAVAWILHRLVLQRISRLDAAARRVAAGDYNVALTADGNDEIGRLASGFTRMAGMIREHTRELEKRVVECTADLQQANQQLEQRNRQILDSIRYAKLIQGAILPQTELLTHYLSEHLVLWQPRDVVGGDFYFLHPAKGTCYLGVVDCTGHGVPGAFMSMTAHAVIRQVLADADDQPLPAILEKIDTTLRETLQHAPDAEGLHFGMDIGLCRFDKTSLSYAGCGIDLFVSDDNGVRILPATQRGLGYRQRRNVRPIKAYDLAPDPSSRYYLVSDGLLDQAVEPEGYGFGRERLVHFLQGNRQRSLSEQKTLLARTLEAYQGQCVQRDDITVLGFSIDSHKG